VLAPCNVDIAMNLPEGGASATSQTAWDALSAALLAAFIALLLAGFLNLSPRLPYSSLAGIPLLGSLVVLWWANASFDRDSRSSRPAPNGA
jgi:hypothetical protein